MPLTLRGPDGDGGSRTRSSSVQARCSACQSLIPEGRCGRVESNHHSRWPCGYSAAELTGARRPQRVARVGFEPTSRAHEAREDSRSSTAQSGWQESNLRSPVPKTGGVASLPYSQLPFDLQLSRPGAPASRAALEGRMTPMPARAAQMLRPYAMHVALLVYTPVVLYADGATPGVGPQIALGIVTFGVLWLAARRVVPARRWEVWLCVPIATLFEALGSLVWGGYTYELQNIPLYVPPGHALVYVFGITAASLPVVRRHGRAVRGTVMARRNGVGRRRVDGAAVPDRPSRRPGRRDLAATRMVRPAVGQGRHVRRDLGRGRDDSRSRGRGRARGRGRRPRRGVTFRRATRRRPLPAGTRSSTARSRSSHRSFSCSCRAFAPRCSPDVSVRRRRTSSRRPWNRTTPDRRIRAAPTQPAHRRR